MKTIKDFFIFLGMLAATIAAVFLIPGTFTDNGEPTGRFITIVVAGLVAIISTFMTPMGGKKDD